MNTLIHQCIQAIREQSYSEHFEVYPAFDMIPVVNKPKNIFVVIGAEKMQFEQPFSDGQHPVTPFRADLRVSVLMPISTPAEKLLDFFYQTAVPGMQSVGGILCSMQADASATDVRLQKIVCTGIFQLKGVFLQEEIS